MMDYLSNNERFADVFNGGCFDGRKVVKPEELEEGSEVYKEVRGRKTVSRTRDLKKTTQIRRKTKGSGYRKPG